MQRRAFLTAAAAAGAALTLPRTSSGAPAAEQAAAFRVSCQEGVVPGKDLREKVQKLAAWGIVGLEVGGQGLARRVKEITDALKDTPVAVSAICAGYEGTLGHHDPAVRAKAVTSMKEILPAAGELGSTGLIVVPAFNGLVSVTKLPSSTGISNIIPSMVERIKVFVVSAYFWATPSLIKVRLFTAASNSSLALLNASSYCRNSDSAMIPFLNSFLRRSHSLFVSFRLSLAFFTLASALFSVTMSGMILIFAIRVPFFTESPDST